MWMLKSISNSQCIAKIQRIFFTLFMLYMLLFMLQQLSYIRKFFLLMNSSSSSLMSYCTLAIEFLALKYYTNSLFYQFFLSHPDFFFSLILSVASFSSFFPLILSVAVASFFLINQMKSEKIKEKKEKRETCS